jgi:transcriptional regulator with XRE-family HTH domain
MTGKELRAIRTKMGLSQKAFGERVRLHGNSIARMERGVVAIVPPIELLIEMVAREHGVEAAHGARGRRTAASKKAGGAGAGHPAGKAQKKSRRLR